ncbi:hypothetical protein BN59_01252 [Legionella massiliensis]|uniref:Uncharacterized protein n=1 Tax=Legionella massiliensis TaxID=1034943 RepID=A0A078KZ38_9GAMM|nr:hypothetical protein [Legionella massiliensis]CDZ76973.1 hypothetical protein BN59_01252 [Legionella massiliensis]CEE12711.1 hypothetical protein BN1094_01252 [Legionella massiliensis]
MFTAEKIEFEPWEEKLLPWVKRYKELLIKTPLLDKDCLGFLEKKVEYLETHSLHAREKPITKDEISLKFKTAVANLVGIYCSAIYEFEDLEKELSGRSPQRDDRDLFSDELKERFLHASEFKASILANPLFNENIRRVFRKTTTPREEAEQQFTEKKQARINSYISVLNKEKEVLQQRTNVLATEEEALNKEYQETQLLIDELLKQIQKDTNELKAEIKQHQPVKQPAVGVAMPFTGAPPPPPKAPPPFAAKSSGLQINKPKSQSADIPPTTSSASAVVTSDVLASFKFRPREQRISIPEPEPTQTEEHSFISLLQRSMSLSSSISPSRSTSFRGSSSISQPIEKPKPATPSIEDVEATLSSNGIKIFRKEELIVHLKERNAAQQAYYKQLLQQKDRLRLLKLDLTKGVSATNRVKKQLEEENERRLEEEKQRVLAVSEPVVVTSNPMIPPPPPPMAPMPPQVVAKAPQQTLSFEQAIALASKKKGQPGSSAKPREDRKATSAPLPVTKQSSQAALNVDLVAALTQRRKGMAMDAEKPKKEKIDREAIAREEALEREKALKLQEEREYRERTLEKHRSLAESRSHEPSDSLISFHSAKENILATKVQLDKQLSDAFSPKVFDDLQTNIHLLIEALETENEQAAIRAKEEEQKRIAQAAAEEEEKRIAQMIAEQDERRIAQTLVEQEDKIVTETITEPEEERAVLSVVVEEEETVPDVSLKITLSETVVEEMLRVEETPIISVGLEELEQDTSPAVEAENKAQNKHRGEVPLSVAVSSAQENPNQHETVPSEIEIVKAQVEVAAEPPIAKKKSKVLSNPEMMLGRINRHSKLKALFDSGVEDGLVDELLVDAVSRVSAKKLVTGTISDLLILRNYAAKKRQQIDSIEFSSEEESERYSEELMNFYTTALTERLSDNPPAKQYENITKAAHAIFTPRDGGLRLFADVMLMISVIGIAIVGVARKIAGHSFFFSKATTQREDDLKSLCKSGEEIQNDGSTLFSAPAA